MTERADSSGPLPAPRAGVDAATLLTVYVFLLFLVPAQMKFPPLGSAGHPSTLVAVAGFFWWLWTRAHRHSVRPRSRRSVQVTGLAFLVLLFAVYARAMWGPLPADEVSPADSGMLRMLGAVGVVLLVADGITSWEGAHRVLRRLMTVVGVISLLAVVQFATGELWVDRLSLPGLSPPGGAALDARGEFSRPLGTATSPIELGAVLAMFLPLSITLARHGERRRRHALVVALVCAALLLVLSRTAMVGCVIGLVALAPAWTWAVRTVVALLGTAMLAVAYVVVPGLLGTLLGLFTLGSDDPSVESRTGAYAVAWRIFLHSPVLGRGYGTFLPRYWILDNLYLQLFIEIGVVGVLVLLAWIGCGLREARSASLAASGPERRELTRSFMAGLLAGAVTLLFYDSFSFPEACGAFFLLLGFCGLVGGLRDEEAAVSTPPRGPASVPGAVDRSPAR